MPLNPATALAGGSAGVGGGGAAGAAGGNDSEGPGAGGAPLLPPIPCTGCIAMAVPIDPAFRDGNGAQNLAAMFNFVFPSAGLDMSHATVTWSVATLTPGAELYVTPYAQNGLDLGYAGVYRPETALTEANGFNAAGAPFVDIVLDLANTAPAGAAVGDAGSGGAAQDAGGVAGAAGGGGPPGGALLDNSGLDKSRIWQLGLRIGAQTRLAAPTTIRVLVDSVTIAGVAGANPMLRSRDFSDGPQELVANTFMLPPGTTGPTKY